MSSIQFYDWLSEPSVKEKLKGEVYKKARTDGKTHAEAREETDTAGKASAEFLDKEDVKEDYQKLKQAQLKQQQANKAVSALENENPNLKVAHDDQRPIANQESSTGINTSELLKLLEYTRAREAQSSASREAFSITSDIREKAEAFAREHPTFAKWGGYALKGIGAAAMAGTLITAAQVGLGAFVVAGTSMAATDQAMAAVIENGTEAFVEYAASHGTNEAEAKKFADTAVWTVEMLLTGAATVGVTKFIKNSGAVVTKLGAIKSNISTLSKSAFQRTQASVTKIDTVSANGIFDAINKAPYNPRLAEALIKAQYGEGNVVSHTMPGLNQPNIKMAGLHKERVVGLHPDTMEPIVQRVTFDQRGFPVFDPYVKVETKISGDLGSMNREAHMRAATRQLRADIETGNIDRKLFSYAELSDIKSGLEKIGTFTWHHHQETGRMQLVPTDVHRWIGHVGGNELWGIQ